MIRPPQLFSRAAVAVAGATTLAAALLVAPAASAGSVGATFASVPAATTGDAGEITTGQAPATAAGAVDFAVYTPPGYDESDERYPTLYLLHGRGDTMAAWQQVKGDLDELISAGTVAPMIVVMPDAPWSQRGNWYTDSLYTGAAGAGSAVETAIAVDLVDYIDATYRTVDDRAARAIGGYSMGGAGALRIALAHQDDFSAGLILSPAAYQGAPPADSSARDYGAYGVGDALYDQARYEALSYESALADFDASLPVHLYLGVGDDEWANPDPADAKHDLDMATHLVYSTARRTPGVTAELRVIDGGHDWGVWQPAFRDGLTDLNSYLRTTPVTPWEAELLGTSGDDRASGMVETADGGTAVALSVEGEFAGLAPAGGLDIIVQRRAADGAVLWTTPIATGSNDRAYGIVSDGSDGFIVGGYTRSDDAGAPGASDQVFVAALTADGDVRWTTRFGDAAAADRAYAIASDGAGGAVLAGYTSGSPVNASAGDKDVLVMRIAGDGTTVWADQFGSSGEDKGQGIALAADGGIYVTGIAGDALPGQASAGGTDAFVAKYSIDGEQLWLAQYGTSATDQAWGAVAREGGVYVIGHTKGALGESNLADHDMYVAAVTDAGTTEWVSQFGTDTDDRAIAGVLGADGGLMVVGATYGAMGDQVGGVDIATVVLSPAGEVVSTSQYGSVERDGADEWDDPNLFVAASSAGVWVTGLTYGSVVGGANQGAGDVFVMSLPYAVAGGETGGADASGSADAAADAGAAGATGGADGAGAGAPPGGGLAATGTLSALALVGFAAVLLLVGYRTRRSLMTP